MADKDITSEDSAFTFVSKEEQNQSQTQNMMMSIDSNNLMKSMLTKPQRDARMSNTPGHSTLQSSTMHQDMTLTSLKLSPIECGTFYMVPNNQDFSGKVEDTHETTRQQIIDTPKPSTNIMVLTLEVKQASR